MALANHRKVIGAELKAYAERVRDIETAAVTMVLRANGVDLEDYPPVAISMLIAQTARSLGNEVAIGVTEGHEELRAFVDRQIDLLSRSRRPQLSRLFASVRRTDRHLRRRQCSAALNRLLTARTCHATVPDRSIKF